VLPITVDCIHFLPLDQIQERMMASSILRQRRKTV